MQALKKHIRINRHEPISRIIRRSPTRGLLNPASDSMMVSPQKAPPIESVSQFLNRAKPPMEMALEPILTRGGSAMVWGPTGIGKSRYGLAISFAIASGGSFLRYTAPKPLKVLHIAAEMTEQEFEKMVKETIATGYTSTEKLSFTHHRNVIYKSRRGIPRFEVCDWWDEACSGFDVINIDNMYGVDPKLNSDHFNEFIRRRNADCQSVIIQHHASKKRNSQLGDAAKEFHLETVIELRAPDNFRPGEPARFDIYYHKHRNFFGIEAQPLPAVEMTHDEWVFGDISPLVEEIGRERIEDAKVKVMQALPNGSLTTTGLLRDVCRGHTKAYILKAALSELETEGLIKCESFGRKGANGKRYSLMPQCSPTDLGEEPKPSGAS